MPKKSPSPFEPFTSVVAACAGLYVAVLIASLVSPLFGGDSLFALGEKTICVTNDSFAFSTEDQPWSLFKPGVAAMAVDTSLCTKEATLGQQVLKTLTDAPNALFYGVALVLLWRLLKSAKRNGPFHAGNATRVRFLGWWLVVGGILAASTQTLATNLLTATMMVPTSAPTWWDGLPGLPMSSVLTGLGLIVVAQIVKAGAQMHDDLVGTV